MRRSTFAALLFAISIPVVASAVEPRIFLVGVWPNRLRFFDEGKEEFVGEISLRYGAVTNVFGSDRTVDYRRFFFVTERMETIEVADLPSRQIVDEVKLSTPERRVRFYGAVPSASGRELFLTVEAVATEVDRFVPEDVDIVRYDLENRKVVDSFSLPAEIEAPLLPPLVRPHPDGKHLYVLSQNIYLLDLDGYQVVDRIEFDKPRQPGYGPGGIGFLPVEAEPGILYGFYRSPDPVLNKPMFGITRIDLRSKEVSSFDVGPDLKVEYLGLSPDGKRIYGGLGDMVAVDLESHEVLALKRSVEQGRQNTVMVVSHDGKKLYVAGVGPLIHVYDTTTLELVRNISAGGDIMNPPQPVPRSVLGY